MRGLELVVAVFEVATADDAFGRARQVDAVRAWLGVGSGDLDVHARVEVPLPEPSGDIELAPPRRSQLRAADRRQVVVATQTHAGAGKGRARGIQAAVDGVL